MPDAAELPGRIGVLELGGGLGLFARLFLESFSRLCRQEGADYYDRLVYVASDGSRRTVERWREAGLFTGHEAHVVLGVCDGTRPSRIRATRGRDDDSRDMAGGHLQLRPRRSTGCCRAPERNGLRAALRAHAAA